MKHTTAYGFVIERTRRLKHYYLVADCCYKVNAKWGIKYVVQPK